MLLVFALAPLSGIAQENPIVPGKESQADIDRIVRTFTSKETQFRQALNDYAFKRDATVQTIGMGGQVTGEYHRVSFFTFGDTGDRFEKINFFPMPTLTELSFTAEDLEDLGGIQPFALEASKIDRYNFRYVGKQRIDELNLYVFDVTPKVIPDPKRVADRVFSGRVWVDDRDLQIVKVRGKGLPETKNNKYPTFDTYREQIDGRYWFPTYTFADDQLEFGSGQVVHLRMKVTYTDYKKARSTVRITEVNGDELETVPDNKDAKPNPTPSPTKPKP
jgi:hypothetical protein